MNPADKFLIFFGLLDLFYGYPLDFEQIIHPQVFFPIYGIFWQCDKLVALGQKYQKKWPESAHSSPGIKNEFPITLITGAQKWLKKPQNAILNSSKVSQGSTQLWVMHSKGEQKLIVLDLTKNWKIPKLYFGPFLWNFTQGNDVFDYFLLVWM